MQVDDRTPVIVGVSQLTVRPGETPLEPVELMVEVLRAAERDSGGRGVLAAADSVRVVHFLSQGYADPAGLVAPRLGLGAVQRVATTVGGNTVGTLLAHTASSIAAGDLDVALLAGAEAWRTRMAARREGVDLGWTPEPPGAAPDLVVGAPLDMSHPAEQALGIWHPIEMYPLFEDALRARAGHTPEEHRALLGRLWSGFSRVAASNPHAWDRREYGPEEIVTPGDDNRMVVTPYTKLLCSNEFVDQAAALVVCSARAARDLGVPTDRWVFPVASAAGKAPYVSERHDLCSSPMIREAGRALWEMAGVGPGDVAHVDLYSCFPSAVEVQATELGFGLDRDLTVTGGMRFFGGPWNHYPMHALATMVDLLRADPPATGLCAANGGFITKQATVLLSATPPREPFRAAAAPAAIEDSPLRAVDPAPAGTGVVEAATFVHDRSGPSRGVVAALLPDGRRGWGIVSDPAALADLDGRDLVGLAVDLHDGAADVRG